MSMITTIMHQTQMTKIKIRVAENRASRRMSRNKPQGRPFFNAPTATATSGSFDNVQSIVQPNSWTGVKTRSFSGNERNLFRDFCKGTTGHR